VTIGQGRRTLTDMTIHQPHAGERRPRRRFAWALFGIVSALALGAGVVADLAYGGGDHLVAVVVSGLCVIGVGAGFMASSSWSSDGHQDPSFASKDGFNTGGWGAL